MRHNTGYRLYLLTLPLFLSLTGCAMLRTILPGGPTMSDAEWFGIKSGPAVSIIGTVDDRAASAALILQTLGQTDPLGVLLPVTLLGETQPRWILCTGKLAAKCQAFPLNAKIHFAGQVVGPGILWKPTRLTADDFDD